MLPKRSSTAAWIGITGVRLQLAQKEEWTGGGLDDAFPAQSNCQRRYAPMVFGIIPECRSAPSGTSVQLDRKSPAAHQVVKAGPGSDKTARARRRSVCVGKLVFLPGEA